MLSNLKISPNYKLTISYLQINIFIYYRSIAVFDIFNSAINQDATVILLFLIGFCFIL